MFATPPCKRYRDPAPAHRQPRTEVKTYHILAGAFLLAAVALSLSQWEKARGTVCPDQTTTCAPERLFPR